MRATALVHAIVCCVIVCVADGARADEPELDRPSVGVPLLAVFPAPSADTPIPPPIVAAPLPPFGHWRIQRTRRGELVTGFVVGAVAYTLTAAVGLGTRDYWLCIPIFGPVVGSFHAPRGMRNPIDYGLDAMMPGVIDLLLQGAFAPLFTMIGYWPKRVWQPE